MASYNNNIILKSQEIKVENEGAPTNEMSDETSPVLLNITPTKESYWFAHGGLEETLPGNVPSGLKSPADLKDLQLQKDREERLRIFREQQEGERLKKLKDLEQQFLLAEKHRKLQEEERRRRIEEARVRETERRHQVEERKRQIYEAEQERKEAILRRNMDREARIEARRNAQRNSQCFAFGSSTPRTFDLDLAAIGIGRSMNQGSVLMSSVSGRRSEERELGPPRATSACSLDRKCGEDLMSRSMVSLTSSAFRGRKKTDIMPTLTRERSITPHVTPRGNHSMRAVSMTRLDQLAQPRRTYLEPRNCATGTTTTIGGPRTVSPSMSKSMCNLANSNVVGRRVHAVVPQTSSGNMSRSMLHLADTSQRENSNRNPSPPLSKSGMRSAHSMMHLAAAPRLTRAARLRAQALADNRTVSAWNLNKAESYSSGHYLSPGKDTSRSPSRPQSSMSGTSEISATSSSVSAVNMRPRPALRRPRPFSIHGSIVDRTPSATPAAAKKEIERQPRLSEKNAANTVSKPLRAKSTGREKNESENAKPLTAPRKPVPPPKSSEVLARAKSHHVPIKDNLRKTVKSSATVSSPGVDVEKGNMDGKVKLVNGTDRTECKIEKSKPESKTDLPNAQLKINSPLTSPTTDSEVCISSEDSKFSVMTESDITTFTQSVTEPECIVEDSKPQAPSEPLLAPEVKQNTFNDAANHEILLESIPHEEKEQEFKNTETDKLQQNNVVVDDSATVREFPPSKPRITSEEEARAALAEKRRLAREQAEREAELERQRQEEQKRKEEEQRRQEELEQRRMEEEQIRLAELHRQIEEEKLRKAIEEQKQREKEENERREEEARQKAEKEEQEKKAREEAEKQRLELEEKLKKEEEERAERKKRVEQIMARTRGKTANSPSGSQNEISKSVKSVESHSVTNPQEAQKTNSFPPTNDVTKVSYVANGCIESKVEGKSINNSCISDSNSWPISEETKTAISNPLPDLLNSEIIANHSVKNNGLCLETEEQLFSKSSLSNSFTITPNRTLSANEVLSPTQTNGYSSHEEMSCNTSPEESAETGLLINIESSPQKSCKVSPESSDFTQLVDIGPTSIDNITNENYLINVDDVNSNLRNSGNPFNGFDDSLKNKQDSTVTADLLS